MKEAIGRQPSCLQAGNPAWGALIGGLLLLLCGACGPGAEVGMGADAPRASASPALGSTAKGATESAAAPSATTRNAAAPAPQRPFLLEPIVEERPAGADRSLGEEDLRNLGELGLLPHVVQSISSGSPCDFSDAMSKCQ